MKRFCAINLDECRVMLKKHVDDRDLKIRKIYCSSRVAHEKPVKKRKWEVEEIEWAVYGMSFSRNFLAQDSIRGREV